MVNANAVNAKCCVFRRRISANFSPLPVNFYVSRIPLNMRACLILTKKRRMRLPRGLKLLCIINT